MTGKSASLLNRVMTRAAQAAMALTLAAVLAPAAQAQEAEAFDRFERGTRPPDVPAGLEVPEGHRVFLIGHAFGTQNYSCVVGANGVATWTLFTPQANLFDRDGDLVTTHFFSPNPDEAGTVRAAWQHARDVSTVWAKLAAPTVVVRADAIPWLKLEAAGAAEGPDGGHRLTATTFIQRINTTGGLAPATGCAGAADAGNRAFVPYTADYIFYKATRHSR